MHGRRLTVVAALAAAVLTVAAVGCSSGGPGAQEVSTSVPSDVVSSSTSSSTPTTVVRQYAPSEFTQTDAALAERVRSAGLNGGMVRIARADGSIIHESTVGSLTGTTPLSVASSTKWITAAVLMTFVDDGVISLDDDISRWLPAFAGSTPAVTARQLLAHTSGVRDHRCQAGGMSLAACVDAIARSPREFPAGTKFSYGNSDFLVLGRLVEVLAGTDFATAVQQRITAPLQMSATTWPGAPAMANSAFGVRITVDDYGKFLTMILQRGSVGGVRVLSADAVDTIVSNQVAEYDTSRDYSVGITKIPRYGLGCWPDVLNVFGGTSVVSGNGGMGLYPWVDYDTKTWGIIGVQDERGAQVAVPASQKVQKLARAAVVG